jgi:hypothetical protein
MILREKPSGRLIFKPQKLRRSGGGNEPTKMFSILLARLFTKVKPAPLGRWGYYWEQKKLYQTYYD